MELNIGWVLGSVLSREATKRRRDSRRLLMLLFFEGWRALLCFFLVEGRNEVMGHKHAWPKSETDSRKTYTIDVGLAPRNEAISVFTWVRASFLFHHFCFIIFTSRGSQPCGGSAMGFPALRERICPPLQIHSKSALSWGLQIEHLCIYAFTAETASLFNVNREKESPRRLRRRQSARTPMA